MTDAPQRPVERVAALLRDIHGGGAHGWTRENAHALLDAALDLAADANDAEGEGGRLAQAAALALSRAVAGWMVPEERTPDEWDALAQEDPAEWREEVAERMDSTPGLLPQHAITQLMFALYALNGATPPVLLQPVPRAKGYGRAPETRRAMEQALLAWIEIAKARGRPALEMQEEVRAATGVATVDAVETWLREWRKRDGREHVARVLALAADLGRGYPVAPPIPDEFLLIRLVASATGGTLQALAENWKAARA